MVEKNIFAISMHMQKEPQKEPEKWQQIEGEIERTKDMEKETHFCSLDGISWIS